MQPTRIERGLHVAVVLVTCVTGCGSAPAGTQGTGGAGGGGADASAGTSGAGTSGAGTSGAGTSGAGTSGAGTSGAGTSGGGTGGGGTGGGGASGTGGGAGAAGTGAGGSSGNTCVPSNGVYPSLRLSPIGAPRPAFSGPAIVERSVGDELVLFFDANAHTGAGGAGGGSGTTSARRVRTFGVGTMPLLPVGSKVWLDKTPDPEPLSLGRPEPAHAFSIRSRQGGTLLFGEAWNAFTEVSSPVAIGAVTPICSYVNVGGCTPGATTSYASVAVSGDTPVVVRHGEPGAIALQGLPYDVRLRAIATVLSGPQMTCADYVPPNYIQLEVRANQLANLAAGLDVGPLPACRQGNEPDRYLNFHLRSGNLPVTYEGAVAYKGRDASNPTTYLFDVPGIAPPAGGPPSELHIVGAAAVLPEPPVGRTFWLSYASPAPALREAQNGPIVLARMQGQPLNGGVAAPLTSLLGVNVALEQACPYTDTVTLWDVVFGTTPPLRVSSGTVGTFTAGGRSYRAWVRADTQLSITIFPGS
jgi:hypothetical protein